jgi:MFS family permease
VQWAALISAVQRLTPEHLQGRLMGAVESLGAIFPAFGYVLGSAIASLASPRIALLVAGAGVTICTIAFIRIPLAASSADAHDAQSSDGRTDARGPERRTRTWTPPHDDTAPQVDRLADRSAAPSQGAPTGSAQGSSTRS